MSARLQLVLPEPMMDRLRQISEADGERAATRASRILRSAISEDVGPAGRTKRPPTRPVGAERPAWLEPFGGDLSWRRDTWGAIVALHGRYPRSLEALKEHWWQDEAVTEVLCALAVWRAEIDEAAASPREELMFHRELEHFARQLREQSSGVASAWVPGAPPEEWS